MKQDKQDILHPESTDFCTLDDECAYLPGKTSRMYYRYIRGADPEFVSAAVRRGWRRFGNYFFRPICPGCTGCKSLRIDVDSFRPTRSRKRVLRKNRDTMILVQPPSLTPEHILLYNRYHAWKAQKDGWKHRDINGREYYENFVEGAHEFGYEVLYLRDGVLVGVDLIDVLEDGISAIYFFHDPDEARLSLGTFSLLYQIELARRLDLRWVYLGYWVDGCKAFAYKTTFSPLEILDGFPAMDEPAPWRAFPASAGQNGEKRAVL